MKHAMWRRLLLACWMILTAGSLGPGLVAARPANPGGPVPAPVSRNAALNMPVLLSTNGALAPLPALPTSDLNTPAITDGNLNLAPLTPSRPDGVLLLYNPTWGRPQAVTITIDLQGSYNISSIR